MKGWQRVAIVLSVIEFVGVGGLLWFQYVGTNNEFMARSSAPASRSSMPQIRACRPPRQANAEIDRNPITSTNT
jgi:hypothetical protein